MKEKQNTKLEKYRYLGKGANTRNVPPGWINIIEEMLSELNRIWKPVLIPRTIMNILHDKGLDKKQKKRFEIKYIKEKYAGLRVDFTGLVDAKSSKKYATKLDLTVAIIEYYGHIIDHTCEVCSSSRDVAHSIAKVNPKRIKNYCKHCREELDYVKKHAPKKKKVESNAVELKHVETSEVKEKGKKSKKSKQSNGNS